MSLLILVVDDESDVEMLFRQQFRRDLRADRFTMEFAQSQITDLKSDMARCPKSAKLRHKLLGGRRNVVPSRTAGGD